jgi:DNA polymerase-3 subunit alpha
MKNITPKKFVGLHAHTGFSVYDGLGYPNEHMDYVIENGMDAWCLTDHGHLNAFGHAYLYAEKLKEAGKNFKFVPGCEMYVHPNLDVWELDYEISRAIRRDDQEAVERLREQRAMIEPLQTTQAISSDSVDASSEDASFTIENENESKSGKFYDPVKRRHHLVVLPKTSEGLERLFHLVSRGYLEGFYRFPRVDYKMLKEAAEGGHLLVSSACIGGPLAYEAFKHFQDVEFDELKPELLDDETLMNQVVSSIEISHARLAEAVGRDNVYLELQFNKLVAQHLVNRALLEFANRNDLLDMLVVTCDSHYARPEYWKEREIYKKLGWLNYENYDPSQLPQSKEDLKCELYPKNAEQVWQTYKETTTTYDFYDDELVCSAIERTHDIVHNEIDEIHPDRSMKLPSYVIPEGQTPDGALLDVCKKGLVERGLHTKPEYIARLKEELGVIKEKEFSTYFLTMQAILDLARTKMLVGPGRGSGAGSLVAYVLNITDIDPIKYDLLFERFLSIHRKGYPDIDTDVGNRDVLLDLMRNKFGKDNIIPISNYNTFKLKSLVKDVSRFYGVPFEEVNYATATVEREVARAIHKRGDDKNMFVLKFDDAMEHCTRFRKFIEKHPEVASNLSVLFKQNKSLGRHAGGVIVSERVKERMPLIMARGEAQTPWAEGMNYKHLETFGWVKFDLLGLETLRVIERAAELILERHEGIKNPTFKHVKDWYAKNIAPDVIDTRDQEVYKNVYHEGRFAGIFQVVNAGAQRLFKRCKPESITDLAALTSIYRPGPLAAGVDKIYNTAKSNPENVDYRHESIKEVLEDTYGAIVFQEQIMQLCNVVAGFPKKDCDHIRRALLKRTAAKAGAQKAEAVALKKQFVEGAVGNGVNAHVASELFEKILFFSGYGFNKSHAVAYSMVSYQCAWLMTYYESEWLCAYLESMSHNPRKRSKAFSEVRSLGYKIVPLDINHATRKWTILEGKKFMPSFLSCKGVGGSAITEIIRNRPYKDMEDMLWNEDGTWRHSKFNKKALDALIRVRAFESMKIVGDGRKFNSYKQLHDIVINHNTEIKKTLKREPLRGKNRFNELLLEKCDTEEWTRAELVRNSIDLFGSFDASTVVEPELSQKLRDKGIVSIDELSEGPKDLYWFVVGKATQKLTKNNKPYLLIEALGEGGGKTRVYCWGYRPGEELPPYSLCVAEVEANDFGSKTFWRALKVIR